MASKFYVKRFYYERTWNDDDDVLVDETCSEVDARGALDAFDEDCWDYEDYREKEVILYPADNHVDMRTGMIKTVHVVVGSVNPRHFNRLVNYRDHFSGTPAPR